MDRVTVFRNWWENAELQADDKSRLAFYDAIFRYAFDGEIPEEVSRRDDRTKRAARAAYNFVKPILDKAKEDSDRMGKTRKKSANCSRTVHEQNANCSRTVHEQNANCSRTVHEQNANCSRTVREPLIEEEIEDEYKETTKEVVGVLPELKIVLASCETMGVPRDFAESLYTELSQFGGMDRDGNPIGNWRRYFKAAWNRERSKAAAALATGSADVAPRRISEDDL